MKKATIMTATTKQRVEIEKSIKKHFTFTKRDGKTLEVKINSYDDIRNIIHLIPLYKFSATSMVEDLLDGNINVTK
jgi:hypothetical protein